MTPQEMKKLRVIDQTIAGTITVREAAELLNLSERQVLRLKKGVEQQGAAFVIHKNRGRKPSHSLSESKREKIIALKRSDKYREANFSHFQELLQKHEEIRVSYPTVYRTLTQAGITSPKQKRKRKDHHLRKRKPREGMLVQIDASPFAWFLDGVIYNLHGVIDDATGKVLGLHFEKTECLIGYFEVTEQMLRRHGIPLSIYNDCHTIFRSPKNGKLSIEEQLQGKQVSLTQFGKAMDQLGIVTCFAKSPQAKGRIERLWETLQSRLPVELKIRGITAVEEANKFLLEYYIDIFNEMFAVEPQDPQNVFRPLPDGIDLTTILCVKDERTAFDGNAFSYDGQYYQLMENGKNASIPNRATITVLDSHKARLRVLYNGKIYETMAIEKPRKQVAQESKTETKSKRSFKPADDHPWKQHRQKTPRLYYDESDRAILEALFNSSRAWA